MRPSEYLALKWQGLDWTRQTVSVVRSIHRVNGEWLFSDTERSRSRRPIKLQSWIVAFLRDLQRKSSVQNLYPEANDLVFRTQLGQPINADYLAKQFRSILDLAGVPRMRPYDLRHSAATIALAAGVSPQVVSEQLGHASTAFTLDSYAHVLPHMQDEAAARVELCSFDRPRDESLGDQELGTRYDEEVITTMKYSGAEISSGISGLGIASYSFRIADNSGIGGIKPHRLCFEVRNDKSRLNSQDDLADFS
jgi:Phage integrase family